MTVVNFLRSIPQRDGTPAPAEGFFRFAPTKPRIIAGAPDNVIAPKPFTVDLVGGALSVTLSPLPAGSAWSVLESVDGVPDERYWVVVPDVAEIDDADLVRVDPSTLAPTAAPEAAWWAVAGSTIVGAAVVGDDLVLTRSDGGTVNAGNVRGPVGPASAVQVEFDPTDPDVILITS
jgi:hypothetical protein